MGLDGPNIPNPLGNVRGGPPVCKIETPGRKTCDSDSKLLFERVYEIWAEELGSDLPHKQGELIKKGLERLWKNHQSSMGPRI